MDSIAILEKLVSFPTVSRDSNLDLLDFVEDLLSSKRFSTTRVYSEDKQKANLLVKIGPEDEAGVLLSGHSDVVPVDNQDWTVPPFELTPSGDKFIGRGTADMKGFLACSLAALLAAKDKSLKTPLWLAISYDEEVGCIGVRRLLDMMVVTEIKPLLCIVGEPTLMEVANGHKGKVSLRLTCHGRGGHSAMAPHLLNALLMASEFARVFRLIQDDLMRGDVQDEDYEIPFSSIHMAKIEGGIAANIVPERATVDFEIRHLPKENLDKLMEKLERSAKDIEGYTKHDFPESRIELEVVNSYPGLITSTKEPVAEFMQSLTDKNPTIKVSYGTEGGLIHERLGVPTIICGPGSMDQGHKADEFISRDQLARCDRMFARLLVRLEAGISLTDIRS